MQGVTISGSGSREGTLTGTRGNVVEVLFATSYCLPEAGGRGTAEPAKDAARAAGKDKSGRTPTPAHTVNSPEPPKQLFDTHTTIPGVRE